MEGLSKSFFELDSAINKASLSAQPRPIIEKTPVRSQEPDAYISKSNIKTKKNSSEKMNPFLKAGIIIAGAFALVKGKGKILKVLDSLKNTEFVKKASNFVKPVTDFVKGLPEKIQTKFPKISEQAGKIFKPVSEKAGKAWNFIKNKADNIWSSIKNIFSKKSIKLYK